MENVLHLSNGQVNQHASDLGRLLRANQLTHELVKHGTNLFAVVGVLVDDSGQNLVARDQVLLIDGHLSLSLRCRLLLLLLQLGLRLHLLGLCSLHLLHLLELRSGHLPLNGSHVAHGHRLRTLVAHHAVLTVVRAVLAGTTLVARVSSLSVVVVLTAVVGSTKVVSLLSTEHEGHLFEDHLEVELQLFLLVKVGPLATGGVLGAESLEILLVLVLLVLNLPNLLDLVVVNN